MRLPGGAPASRPARSPGGSPSPWSWAPGSGSSRPRGRGSAPATASPGAAPPRLPSWRCAPPVLRSRRRRAGGRAGRPRRARPARPSATRIGGEARAPSGGFRRRVYSARSRTMRALHPSLATPASAAGPPRADGLSPLLLEWLEGEPLAGRALLDVGTGTGRLALALAARAQRVVGIDTALAAMAAARRRARRLRYQNARFVAADAEQADYRALAAPDVVVAHLCLSDAIVKRAAAGLPGGGLFAFAAFGADQW